MYVNLSKRCKNDHIRKAREAHLTGDEPMDFMPTPHSNGRWATYCSRTRQYVAFGTKQDMMESCRVLNNAADRARLDAAGVRHHAPAESVDSDLFA